MNDNDNDMLAPVDLVKEAIEKLDMSRDPKLWETLIVEEAKEVKEAFVNLLKEVCDFLYVTSGLVACTAADYKPTTSTDHNTATSILLTMIELDVDLFNLAFRAVHQSNLSKLGDDGKPLRREDGKILKGPNYKAPDLTTLFDLYRAEGVGSAN